jgi:PTS system galactitol-specific IIA component
MTTPFDTSMTHKSLTIVDLVCKDKVEVIEYLADLLFKAGYVKDSYVSNVLAREAIMPTGLLTKAGGVAIPHTDSEHVNRSAMAIGLLKNPVFFKNMAAPTEDVEVRLVFLLAIAEKSAVITVLSHMAEMFLDPEVLSQAFKMRDSKGLAAYISSVLNKHPVTT